MSIKPDHWIRRMAQKEGMIEPYVDTQKRAGVVSYGLSSYGYDIRVADDFMIFTNVNSAIVDPKDFDPQSFVKFQGDVCLIPPNSFALARSIEYIRMPNNVLGIVLGKSTYARCFRGDTRVALVDGTAPTLEEMAQRHENGEKFWGYSIDSQGQVIATLLDQPRYIGRDALLEVILDNGESIYCTPDHKFVLRSGGLEEAMNLRPGTSLMPLYRNVYRGYEMVYQPSTGQPYPTHRLADEWNLRNGIYQDDPNTHRHHVDHNKRNNAPHNIIRMDATEHIRHHNQDTFGENFDSEAHSAAIREAFQELYQDEEWYANFVKQQQQRALRFWNDDQYQEARERLSQKQRESWTEERRQKKSEQMRDHFRDPEKREHTGKMSKQAWARDDGTRREKQREIMQRNRLRAEITEDALRQALSSTGSIRGAARLLECDRSVFRRFPHLIEAFKEEKNKTQISKISEDAVRQALESAGSIRGAAGLLKRSRSVFRGFPHVIEAFKAKQNHKVVAINELPGDHDVYCLTVPEAGNFALEAGVFVRNCGIITNFTPLEPGWEGHITIEISNTTPLPAKIYANEGIAQVIFFESDEACEVSYADKKGKYQRQLGITLPKL